MSKLFVISFCLWGNLPIYNIGAIENAKLAQKFFPNFVCWYYIHAESVPKSTIIELLKFSNVRIIYKSKVENRKSMLWRLEPADDDSVEILLSRDTDSRLSLREAFAVNEFVESNYALHVMRDHPQHYPNILGGMFGVRPSKVKFCKTLSTWENEIAEFYKYTPFTTDDQLFLTNALYTKCINRNLVIIHDEMKKYEASLCRLFPLLFPANGFFIGGYVSENGELDEKLTEILFKECSKNRIEKIPLITQVECDGTLEKLVPSFLINVFTCTDKSPVKIIGEITVKNILNFYNHLQSVYWDEPKSFENLIYNPERIFPSVSVIIPSFNRFSFLVNAVESVKNQTYLGKIEIIVINDGSTQEEYYSMGVKNILPKNSLYITNITNSGNILENGIGKAAYARNLGISLATGDYIAFLDDDDVWLPSKLEQQIRKMKETRFEMCATEGYTGHGVYNSSLSYPKYIREYNQFLNCPKIWSHEYLTKHNMCINSSVILSRKICEKIGKLVYKRVGEDWDYWLRATKHTQCCYISEPLVYYDLSHGTGSQY